MSTENYSMKLRPRKSVLGDVTNRASNIAPPAPGDASKQPLKSKRMRTSLEPAADNNAEAGVAPTSSSSAASSSAAPTRNSPASSLTNNSTSADADGGARKKRRSSAGEQILRQEELPLHVIRRSMPLVVRNTDPAQCLDQIDRMYNIYYEQEEEFSAKPYMSFQRDINYKMRSILIDWLLEVHMKFKLQPQTLYLCVNILDRYLEKEQTVRSKLQLVGVTALLIACKYEEIYPPEVRDCVYITDYAYERAEVLQMESKILKVLDYKIAVPTAYHFLIRYLNCIQASERTRNLASYYAERNLQEGDVLLVRPHKFAASAVYAALRQQNDSIPALRRATVWSRLLQEESGLQEEGLKVTARTVIKHVHEEPETASKRKLVAAKKKYATDKFGCISSLELPII